MPHPLLIAVICVSSLGIYISVEADFRSPLDRYTRWFLGYLVLYAIHTWGVNQYFGHHVLLDHFSPYGLLYGPFLYFAYQMAGDEPLKIRPALLHAVPFLVFLTAYVVWFMLRTHFPQSEPVFRLILSLTTSCSLISYAGWALFFRSTHKDKEDTQTSRILSALSMLLAFVSVITLVATFSHSDATNARARLNGAAIFLTMLGASVILFSHIVHRAIRGGEPVEGLVHDGPPDAHVTERNDPEDTVDVRYQKSAIASETLDTYEGLLKDLMEKQQVYLDDRLSLASLAHLLKIPKHHLSQVFSLRIGKNFNTYVNEYRVNHAIKLMHTHPEMSVTDIFFSSGFISRASFNRYFKQFKGCTPTEYRNDIV